MAAKNQVPPEIQGKLFRRHTCNTLHVACILGSCCRCRGWTVGIKPGWSLSMLLKLHSCFLEGFSAVLDGFRLCVIPVFFVHAACFKTHAVCLLIEFHGFMLPVRNFRNLPCNLPCNMRRNPRRNLLGTCAETRAEAKTKLPSRTCFLGSDR